MKSIDLSKKRCLCMTCTMQAKDCLCDKCMVNGCACHGACKEVEDENKCRKCGGEMKKGKAIKQTFTGRPDFIGGDICTISPGGIGKIMSCLKCVDCGWSVTI